MRCSACWRRKDRLEVLVDSRVQIEGKREDIHRSMVLFGELARRNSGGVSVLRECGVVGCG